MPLGFLETPVLYETYLVNLNMKLVNDFEINHSVSKGLS